MAEVQNLRVSTPISYGFLQIPLLHSQSCKSFLCSLGLGQSLIMCDLSLALESHSTSNKYGDWIPLPPNRFSIKGA